MGMRGSPKLICYGSAEPLWIVRPLRERGRRIPRFVWTAGEHEPHIGRLHIDWTESERHKRRMHVATLTLHAKDFLPCIRDVHIIRLSVGDLTLAGFEEVEDREYAQTWFCRLLREGWEHRRKPDDPTGGTFE
jgi:hypothetical protein